LPNIFFGYLLALSKRVEEKLRGHEVDLILKMLDFAGTIHYDYTNDRRDT